MARRNYARGGFTRGSITGTREAVKMIQDLGEDVLVAAKEALKSGADIIVQDAKSRCPVSVRGEHPGELRESIKAVSKNKGTMYEISAEAQNKNGVYYGQFVEFDPRIDEPFLYPAMDANRAGVHAMIAQAINDAVEKKRRR